MPKPDLNKVLAELDPQNLIDTFLLNHDLSRRKYPIGNMKVLSYNEFVNRTIHFYFYHLKNTAGGTHNSRDLAWTEVIQILENSYSNLRCAFAAAQTGLEGGFEGCLDKIYLYLRKKHINAFFERILTTEINPLNFSEIVELMRQLRARFYSSVPQNYRVLSAAEMAADYKNFIRLYIEKVAPIRLRVIT